MADPAESGTQFVDIRLRFRGDPAVPLTEERVAASGHHRSLTQHTRQVAVPVSGGSVALALAGGGLMPGENFAHEHKCPAVGNRVMSRPTSAMMIAAATGPIPGITSRRWTAWSKGAR